MKKRYLYILFILSGMLITGCEKPYDPTPVTANLNYLVVEGLINTGSDSTIIKLSRTVNVANKKTANPETKATITVENAQGAIYTLTEIANGTYASAPVPLDNSKQYRIRIKTSNGSTYLSDLVDAKVTPPIDSVGFAAKDNGLLIYANTHDATNNTHYYKYSYQETWRFHTYYYTDYVSDGTYLLHRTPEQNIYYCYGHDRSPNTIVNSTAALTQDIGYQVPISIIDRSSEKVQIRYSILLFQQALTKDAYTYWDNLRNNESQLGTLFSSQPTQLTGNIHNVNNKTEPVIGYIGASTVQQKRIFIDSSQLPKDWMTANSYGCSIDSAFFNGIAAPYLLALPAKYFAINHFSTSHGEGYTYTPPPCADCTTRGFIQQPAFWK